jgi:hypothetical protein
MPETEIGPAYIRCGKVRRRMETLFVRAGADHQEPSSVEIFWRHPWRPTIVEMNENVGMIGAVESHGILIIPAATNILER